MSSQQWRHSRPLAEDPEVMSWRRVVPKNLGVEPFQRLGVGREPAGYLPLGRLPLPATPALQGRFRVLSKGRTSVQAWGGPGPGANRGAPREEGHFQRLPWGPRCPGSPPEPCPRGARHPSLPGLSAQLQEAPLDHEDRDPTSTNHAGSDSHTTPSGVLERPP